VTGWFVSESSSAPSAESGGWSSSEPNSFTLSSGDGMKTVYVWAKDAAGNVSSAGSDTINVVTNVAPVLGSIPAQSATQNSSFSLDLSSYASDANADSLTFDISGLPTGLSYSSDGSISGGPTESGDFTITVKVSDGNLDSNTKTFNLHVEPEVVVVLPEWTSIPSFTRYVNGGGLPIEPIDVSGYCQNCE